MSDFCFEAEDCPFPGWLGPYSPARGTSKGFRFYRGQLGTWVTREEWKEFWVMEPSRGVHELSRLVLNRWGGGRIALLPNGLVVKPLQGEYEAGRRVVIGRFHGSVVLARPDGDWFDLSNPGNLEPGERWPGPDSTGLECSIDSTGSLKCRWYHPSRYGRETVQDVLLRGGSHLVWGFRRARPGSNGGRVRVTANGQIITNRQSWDGSWAPYYVGHIDTGHLPRRPEWIERG
jgi:hypothetical protein